jgi:hypothetical protein
MASKYPSPKVSGVVSGVLNVDETPEPVVTVQYERIDKPHTVSVLWEVRGPINRWLYCCELKQQPANAEPSLEFIPLQLYSNEKSSGNNVRVRYSISIDGEAPVDSDAQEFQVVREMVPAPGGGLNGLAIRETMAQWLDQNGIMILYVDLTTDSIGEDATIYAEWSNMATQPRRLTWDKPSRPGVIWQSEPQTAQNGLGVFKIPKKELLRLNNGVGVLRVTDEKYSTESLYVAINMTFKDEKKREDVSELISATGKTQ